MLNSLANHLAASRWQRHLFFLTAALFIIAFTGYHFGVYDQTSYLPFLEKDADNSLYPGDAFLDLRFEHYSYFWFFFQPLYGLTGGEWYALLAPVMFGAHLLATYLTFWMLWELSTTLFGNPLASLLSCLAFVCPHLGFAGFPLFEFCLLNRSFVLPFILLSLTLYLRRRYLPAFGLLGVLYNLHVISVNFALAMLALDCLLRWRQIGWRNLLGGAGLFLLGASPVLLWRLTGITPTGTTVQPAPALGIDREWFNIIALGTLYNLFELLAPHAHIALSTLNGLGALALFFIGRQAPRPTPALADQANARQHDRTVLHFVCAIILILIVQEITAHWLPLNIIVQAQIIRIGLFALVFGYLYFGRYLAEHYQANHLHGADFGLLAAVYIASPMPIAPALAWLLHSRLASAKWRQAAIAITGATLFLLAVGLITYYRLWFPGIYIFPRATAWHAVQIWARQNTPKEALFITPPHRWSFYESDWRVLSGRSTLVTHTELLEAAFVPDYIRWWRPRFEAVAPGVLERFRGNFFENQALVAQAFYSLTTTDFERLAQQYGAAYLVLEKPHTCGAATIAYENEAFIVCDLRSSPPP